MLATTCSSDQSHQTDLCTVQKTLSDYEIGWKKKTEREKMQKKGERELVGNVCPMCKGRGLRKWARAGVARIQGRLGESKPPKLVNKGDDRKTFLYHLPQQVGFTTTTNAKARSRLSLLATKRNESLLKKRITFYVSFVRIWIGRRSVGRTARLRSLLCRLQ